MYVFVIGFDFRKDVVFLKDKWEDICCVDFDWG